MKFTNLSKLLIKFIGGGLINFPTNNLREVEIEPFDGEGGETMDFKTYCDTVFRNYLIDNNIPIEDVVMPDTYVQIYGEGDDDITTDGDYLKPYNFIVPLYNDALVIDESKMYFESVQSIMIHSLLSGNFAKKDTSISFENYCAIAQKLI